MPIEESSTWPACDQEGCTGIRLDAGGKCLAHVGDEQLDAALRDISETGKIYARGVTISSALLEKILGSVPRGPKGRSMFTEAWFDEAIFQGDAQFGDAIFQSDARFAGAVFQGMAGFAGAAFRGEEYFHGATFHGTTFHGGAQFSDATFRGRIQFGDATFRGRAQFSDAIFRYGAEFDGATFHQGGAFFDQTTFEAATGFNGATFGGEAWFDRADLRYAGFGGATFQGGAQFHDTTFRHTAWFSGASFRAAAEFDRAIFQGDAQFSGAIFQSNARFAGAVFQGMAGFAGAAFERAQQFGPVLAHRGLNLDGVQFVEPVQIEATTIGMCCRQARFRGGVQFRLRWARVVLDDTDLSAPSLLTGIPRMASDAMALWEQSSALREQRIIRAWQRLLAGQISEQPRLLSLQRTNVAGLGLANINLADCRFTGAHNLDKLRLEADVVFGLSPARLGWERRQVIAEESAWRADQTRPGRWTASRWPDWAGSEKPVALNPGAVAGLYRALRKGREDAKDEPGAADFYYGEMEMRRHANEQNRGSDGVSRGRADRGVLTAYWLVSGYGLRAWRALVWLAGVTVAFAFAFHLAGFIRPPQPASYWTSLLYAFRSTISLTDDHVTLTAWGQLLQALLRLTGPVLLGFALLALRGRIKR